jgi:excisionase family DNA binding protein
MCQGYYYLDGEEEGKHMAKKYMSAKEVAELLGVKVDTIYSYVLRKKIPCIRRRGVRTRFDSADIEKWIEEGKCGVDER